MNYILRYLIIQFATRVKKSQQWKGKGYELEARNPPLLKRGVRGDFLLAFGNPPNTPFSKWHYQT
jgi:hypothetical protein